MKTVWGDGESGGVPRMRSRWLAAFVAVAALALAAGAATAGAAVKFSPKRVAQGGVVTVKAPAGSKARTVFLGRKRAHRRKSDVRLGRIAARRRAARLRVPVSTRPGRYFVTVCRGGGCAASKKKLTVTGKGGPYRYVLEYRHSDSAAWTKRESSVGFIGTTTFRQKLGLKSRIPLKGDAASRPAKGAGAIAYLKGADYLYRQVGSFSSQAGGAGGPGGCPGTSTATLTGTTPGTARVLGLTVKGAKISLDFSPGPIFQGGGAPSESLHYVDAFTEICADATSDSDSNLFLGTFGNFYQQRQQLVPAPAGGRTAWHAHLDEGWKLSRSKHGAEFATLKVRGAWNAADPSSSFVDAYTLYRYPKSH